MENTNTLTDYARKNGGIDKATVETMAILLAPFAPHIAEEIWERLGNTVSVFEAAWPTYDKSKLMRDTVTYAIQVNGKLRDSMEVAVSLDKDCVIAEAKKTLGVKLNNMEIIKEIYVPNRIVNFVVKQ
jgi:leucyl-tRNA synthetase